MHDLLIVPVSCPLPKALHAAQRHCEELEEALNSRTQVVEMLQQEVSSADQQKQVEIHLFQKLDSVLPLCVTWLRGAGHAQSHPHLCLCLFLPAQILTAQFRQMEQELAEAVRQREEEKQQWAESTSRADAEMAALRSTLEALERQSAEVVTQESELAALREAERISQEALEKERLEVARLESEVVEMKDAKLTNHEASERDKAEIVRLENELALLRDTVDRACQDATEREKLEVEKLEQELTSQREDGQKKGEILAEVWRHLQSLAAEEVTPTDDPADLPLLLSTVQSVETQLTSLKDECREGEKRCVELTHTVEDLQGEK